MVTSFDQDRQVIMSGLVGRLFQVMCICNQGPREVIRKQRTKHEKTAGESDDEVPRNDEEVMLARQGPWQACWCGGGEGQPLERWNLGTLEQRLGSTDSQTRRLADS